MKRANRLMLVAGVALAAVSFVAVLAFGNLGQPAAPPDAAPEVSVVVAARELPLGTEIAAADVSTVNRPETDAVDAFRYPEELVGQIVRREVAQGQAFTQADFQTTSNVPDLARFIRPGLRAIAVPLARVDAVGALLQSGDYVDVLISLEDLDQLNPLVVPNPGSTSPLGTEDGESPYILLDDYINNTSVKVVVQNVQVLAALQPDAVDPNTGEAPAPGTPDMIAVLAVTPQQAEVIRFAELDGNISLVLRAPGDYGAGDTATSGITLRELVDRWGVLPPAPVGN